MQVLLDHPDPHQDLPATVDRILTDFGELDLAETPDGPQLAEILTNICPPASAVRSRRSSSTREPPGI